MSHDELQNLVNQWLAWDPNEKTRAEIKALVAAGNEATLRERLTVRISFGTAGLRGAMQAGFSSMNDLTVIQASQGFVTYLLEVSTV
jgi:phosphoglucomutase